MATDEKPPAARDEATQALMGETQALREEVAGQREEARVQQEKESAGEQLKNRVAIAAIVFTTALSFIGNVKSNRDGARNDAEKVSQRARLQGAELWAYYQTRAAERTSLDLARDRVELDLKKRGLKRGDPEAQLEALRLETYEERIRGIDDQNRQVFFKVQSLEQDEESNRRLMAEPERASSRYDIGNKLITLSLILLSVTILAGKRQLFWFGVALGGAGILLAINGYLLLF